MILDKNLLFSSAQAVTVTAPSTDVLDLLNARDMGVGDAAGATPKLMCLIGAAFTAAGAATLQIQFQGSTDNVTYTTYAETAALAVADLTAGRLLFPIDVPRPPIVPGTALPRYYRLNFIVATGPMTAGTITAGLVLTRQDDVSYPPGVAVYN